jgi:hypothetical protein
MRIARCERSERIIRILHHHGHGGYGSTNWFYNSKAEVTKLRDAYERAVAAAGDPAPAGDLAAAPAPEPGGTKVSPARPAAPPAAAQHPSPPPR